MGPQRSEGFDAVMSRLDQPMVVITAADGRERSGCMVGFHVQCSIEPRQYAVWVSKANHTYGVACRSEHLAIHWLGTGDSDLAELFGGLTGDEVDKFALCEWDEGPGGVPLLRRLSARMVGRRAAIHDDGGDHVCVVVDPIQLPDASDPAVAALTPLRLSQVARIEPGHPA